MISTPRLPTPGEIVEVIYKMPDEVERCIYAGPCRPMQFSDMMECGTCRLKWDVNDPAPPKCGRELNEVWIDFIGVWVDFDGKRYSGDQGRGYAYPGWFDAWRIRRALRWWMRRDD